MSLDRIDPQEINQTDKVREELQARIDTCTDKMEVKTKDLQDKIDAKGSELQDKIEDKVSHTLFYWSIGILITVVVGIGGYALTTFFSLYNNLDTQQREIRDKVIALETKSDAHKKK